MTEEDGIEEVTNDEEVTPVAGFTNVCTMNNQAPDKIGSIQVVARKDGKEAIVFYDYGDNLADMVELFGADVVFTNARSKMKIGLQAGLRSYLKSGGDIEALMGKYKPGVALEKIPADMGKATETYFSGLDENEQDAMIARLMERKNA